MMFAPNTNRLWADLIVEELVRCGVDLFCLSPGSRCAPLTTAVAANPSAYSVVHYDERGAAFYALGHARATGRPAALVCTSGTAAANYLPAVVEASQACVPLVLLTADRPPEVIDTGANQTIRQAGLYGKHVRWESTLSCPTTDVPPEAVLTVVDQALHHAIRPPSGPVHLNCPYREPLAPVRTAESFADYLKGIRRWDENPVFLGKRCPYTLYAPPLRSVDPANHFLALVGAAIQTTTRGCIIVGQLDPWNCGSILRLAIALQWPVLSDVTSHRRVGASGTLTPAIAIPYYDQLLLSRTFRSVFRPETVIHFGGPFISKRLMQHIEQNPPQNYFHIAPNGLRHDPINRVTLHLEADIEALCDVMVPMVKALNDKELAKPLEWTGTLTELSHKVDRLLGELLDESDTLSEPAVSRIVSKTIPNEHALFLGNSMPVRDMDMYGAATGKQVAVFANRGASGIDGNIATAAGIAQGGKAPVTAIIGDVAALHDLNSLSLLSKTEKPVILIVINNDGGGIFHFLPIAGFPDVFERYFAAPHGLRFDKAAGMFGLQYFHPTNTGEFKDAYLAALGSGDPALIEVTTDREENLRVHKAIQERIVAELDGN